MRGLQGEEGRKRGLMGEMPHADVAAVQEAGELCQK